jgi:hypothetical protein
MIGKFNEVPVGGDFAPTDHPNHVFTRITPREDNGKVFNATRVNGKVTLRNFPDNEKVNIFMPIKLTEPVNLDEYFD